MEAIYAETFMVSTWDVDYTNRFTLAAAFNYFQEVAGEHAGRLGVGKERLEQQNLAWVLSRMSVVMFRRPQWREKIVVETWPRGTTKLFAIRDYSITDEKGQPVALARSGWLLIDLDKMRPIRPQILTDSLPTNDERLALEDGLPTLSEEKTFKMVGKRQAAYSDIDYNGHVNNARYIQWVQDVVPLESWQHVEKVRLDINYISEVKPGETILLYSNPEAQTGGEKDLFCPWKVRRRVCIEGHHENSLQSAFRAELRYEV